LLKETVLAFELITDYESDVLPIVPCCPDWLWCRFCV